LRGDYRLPRACQSALRRKSARKEIALAAPKALIRRRIMATQRRNPSPKGAAATPADLTLDDVRAAAARIAGAVVNTPMMHSITLSEITGADIWLKFENLQFTAAYKERGALNALLLLTEEQRSRGVIAASAGNHSQGLSYHGTRLGVPVTIVMPRTTPTVKVMQTESVGGKVVLEGETFDEAYAHARKLEGELGLTFVHPFDDPACRAGAGHGRAGNAGVKPDLDCSSCRSAAAG
jgi:threonine dehydratase